MAEKEISETDLDNILESALEDFEEQEIEEKKKTEIESEKNSQRTSEKKTAEKSFNSNKNEVEENFNKEMKTTEGIDELVNNLQKVLQGVASGNDSEWMEFLKKYENKETPDVPDLDMSEEEMKKLLDSFQNSDPSELESAMMDFMKSLVSPSLLHEPIKAMQKQYPEWLEKNKSSLSAQEYQRYTKQYECVCQIAEVYDKGEDISKLFPLIQKMQETGQPPSDIVKSIAPDTNTNTQLPEECSLM